MSDDPDRQYSSHSGRAGGAGADWALITGASSGIGREMAMECARRGWGVVLVALPGDELEAAAGAVAACGGPGVYACGTDLTEADSAARIQAFCEEHGVVPRLLINNAGMGNVGALAETPGSLVRTMLRLNNDAVVQLTRRFLPALASHRSAYVLNVASLAALAPTPYKAVYSASKGFIYSFSLALREECRSTGVSVSVLVPGPVPTNAGVRHRISQGGRLGRVGVLPADFVARVAVKGVLRSRAVIIPGWFNRLYASALHLVPGALSRRIFAGIFRSHRDVERDVD